MNIKACKKHNGFIDRLHGETLTKKGEVCDYCGAIQYIEQHKKIKDFVCICGFEADGYRGLNSHIGNKLRNMRLKK